jgi:hypothetical protein
MKAQVRIHVEVEILGNIEPMATQDPQRSTHAFRNPYCAFQVLCLLSCLANEMEVVAGSTNIGFPVAPPV